MEKEIRICPGEWVQYADGRHFYSFVRCLEQDKSYEVVCVSYTPDFLDAYFVHQVLFVEEYTDRNLEDVVTHSG